MTDDEIRYELKESKRRLENMTGKPVISCAYPLGSYDDRVMDIVKERGYQFGISYEHMVRRFDRQIGFKIPRIHIELETTYPLFIANLTMPWLFLY
jgi:peptidoglycan/xylan/chitin deacetylase (PgdA/CDA1 family)